MLPEKFNNQYVVRGNNNQTVQGSGNTVSYHNQINTGSKENLTKNQVVELFAELEEQIQQSELPEDLKNNTIKRLGACSAEVNEQEPDKQLAASNLKRVTETLTEASKTSEAAKKLWSNIAPTVLKIGGWLGVASKLFLGGS